MRIYLPFTNISTPALRSAFISEAVLVDPLRRLKSHVLTIWFCLFALDIRKGFEIPRWCYCTVISGNLTPVQKVNQADFRFPLKENGNIVFATRNHFASCKVVWSCDLPSFSVSCKKCAKTTKKLLFFVVVALNVDIFPLKNSYVSVMTKWRKFLAILCFVSLKSLF